jgi:uncharacterized protein YcgI (DUF1989 family)
MMTFNDAIAVERKKDLEVRWVAVSGQEVVDFGAFNLDDMAAKATIEIRDNRELARALHVTAIPLEPKPEPPK